MKANLFIIMFSIFSFSNAQNTCNYTEVYPVSHLEFCEGDISILIFTSSIDTIIKGDVFAEHGVLIIPTQGYNITILPKPYCEFCAEEGGTATIGTKKGGGKNKIAYPNSQETTKQKIIIEKNPVDDVLALSINKGFLKKLKIYNANGQEVLSKDDNDKTISINVSRLVKGVYWIKAITNENKTYTKQFIKK